MAVINYENVCELFSKTTVAAFESDEVFVPTLDKSPSEDFKQTNYMSGNSVKLTLDNQPGAPVQSSDIFIDSIVQGQVTLTALQWNEAILVGSVEEQYNLGGYDRVVSKIFKPYSNRMVTQANIVAYQTACATSSFFGTPGSDLTNFLAWGRGAAFLQNQLAPADGWFGCMSPDTMIGLADNVKNAFNPSKDANVAYMDGKVKEAAGINFFTSTNIPTHTNGSAIADGVSGMRTNGTILTGATAIIVDGGTSAGTITLNSLVTFQGVYDVQPDTKATLRTLKTFNVTSLTTLSGGAGTINISPAVYGPENPKLQNCSILPTNDLYVSIVGGETTASITYEQAFIYQKKAQKFVGLPLPELIMLKNSIQSYEGIPIRASMGGNITTSQNVLRVDMFIGTVLARPQNMARAFTRALR